MFQNQNYFDTNLIWLGETNMWLWCGLGRRSYNWKV